MSNQLGLDSLYRTGNRTEYVCGNKSACLCNDLAFQHVIALRYQWFRRCANVLGQRINHDLAL